jgi:hypothetical protein
MIEDDRAKKRQESREHLDALRSDPSLSERAYRLFELLTDRLDRLETGSFPTEETPTAPERRPSSAKWSNQGVIKALEEGRKKDEDE